MKPSRPEVVPPSEPTPSHELQPNLVLPQENSDDHPLMKKYAKISEQALKNRESDPEDETLGGLSEKVG
jgi:hypothetical protein